MESLTCNVHCLWYDLVCMLILSTEFLNMLRRHYDACIYTVENGGVLEAKITIFAPDFHTQRGRKGVLYYAVMLCMRPYYFGGSSYIIMSISHVLILVSCAPNHVTHTMDIGSWTMQLSVLYSWFVAKHWCTVCSETFCHHSWTVKLNCGYKRPLKVHRTLSPLQVGHINSQ